MLPATSKYYSFWIQGVVFFIACTVLLAGGGYNMILDGDPLWHVAAGDLIRSQGNIPLTDPWSFTAGDYRWLNVSWLWDSAFSYIVEKLGWSGASAVNSIIIAAVLAITYTHCLLRSGNGIASFLTIILLFMMFHLHLRPVHVTHLMVALWMLVLGLYIRHECRACWLALLPCTMLIWVNSHGGFILGYIIIGMFGLGALIHRNTTQFNRLVIVALLCVAAAFATPYGLDIIETVMRPLTTVANDHIMEWQPLTLNLSTLINCLFLVLFVALVIGRSTHATRAERWLAYAFFLYGLTTNRALYVFIIIGAPMLAYRLSLFMKESSEVSDAALRFRSLIRRECQKRRWFLASSLLAIVTPVALLQSVASGLLPEQNVPSVMKEEIAFITTHYPKGRFINDFDLGGYIVYNTRGALPVFIDPRTETAFSKEVMQDFFAFRNASSGWESVLDKYRIDGLIIPRWASNAVHDRFSQRIGWKTAFTGKDATIYVRDAH